MRLEPPPEVTARSTPAAQAPAWLPIRALGPGQRSRIAAHLMALDADDRYLRFGYPASDGHVARYVEQIDFEHDEVFGVFNRRLELVAAAHLAAAPGSTEAEFGVSVLAKARGRGYGARLFDRAVLHARNRGIREMVIYALSENTAMLRIVRKAGATVDRDGGESCARLRLPADDLMSHLEALVEDSASEVDYRLKQGTRRDEPPAHER